ncbi:MAG TPA: cytochrome c biogenesis protein CcdA [Candidatus Aminicenantes bacterium]|nr:cytochrome c biogenesis protein CcdA [Candidatus Aminicenantes bacterium]
MLESLFTWVTQLLYGHPLVGLFGALIWGILSILLSPCHLASIPLIVGFVSRQETLTTRKAFRISLAFALGILTTIGLIGVITSLLGRMLGDIGRWSNYLVAGIFVLVGLYLLGIIRLELPGAANAKARGKGAWAGFVLGLLFGLALGPCTFAYLAPILAIVLAKSSTSLVYGVPLLLAYGIGHCAVIVFAGTFTRVIENYLRWNESSKALNVVKKICGILLFMAAAYMIWSR